MRCFPSHWGWNMPSTKAVSSLGVSWHQCCWFGAEKLTGGWLQTGHPAMSPLPPAVYQQQGRESTDLLLKSWAISHTWGGVYKSVDSEILESRLTDFMGCTAWPAAMGVFHTSSRGSRGSDSERQPWGQRAFTEPWLWTLIPISIHGMKWLLFLRENTW